MLFKKMESCGTDVCAESTNGKSNRSEYLYDIAENISVYLNFYRMIGQWDSAERRFVFPFNNISQNEEFIQGIIRYIGIIIQDHEARVLNLKLKQVRQERELGLLTIEYKSITAEISDFVLLAISVNNRFWFKVEFRKSYQ